MKNKLNLCNLFSIALLALACQGCIAFPPLIQVEHKDSPEDKEILRRLDAIDRRLDALEKSEKKP
jgi:hypothetical protein